MPEASALRTTALNSVHRALGAKMVDFGGWDMPVQYSGIIEEHQAVRHAVGVFDVSHMGEIEISGPDAAHQDKDYAHISAVGGFDAEVEFSSPRYAQIAIQGPKAIDVLQQLTPAELADIRYYWFVDDEVSNAPARIARTGYTGEDGFEIYIAPEEAERIWHEILRAGRNYGIRPCGLGARNTLRLEAKMALYGHEIHASITPFEADLGWIVKMEKGPFIGRGALARQLERYKDKRASRKLAGFEMRGRG